MTDTGGGPEEVAQIMGLLGRVVPTEKAQDGNRASYRVPYAADKHQLDESYLVVE